MKKCTKCLAEKQVSDFYKDAKNKDGYANWCKSCVSVDNKGRQRRRKYGISPEVFTNLLEQADHKCSICERPLDTSACVDHCHTTKKVRGVLCRPCNAAIGMLGDTFENVMRAANYLKAVENGI